MSERPRRAGARRGPLRVWPLDTSGCGACAQSVAALAAPRYAKALRAVGVTFARSPRHADVALITGALSRQARAGVARALAAMPEPRALVAVGDCAIDGCVFRGSPEVDSSVAETLDAHVELPGCPPPPTAILEALRAAQRLLAGEDGADAAPGAEVELMTGELVTRGGGESEGGAKL